MKKTVSGLLATAVVSAFALAAYADGTFLAVPNTQNWNNTAQISTDDDWSGVAGYIGYRGDALTAATGTDPQTIVADGDSVIDIDAQQTPTFISGGLAEMDALANPVVALQGSGTADAPNLVLHLNTSGFQAVTVAYLLRDVDDTADNAIQPVALQYRVGTTGNYTNLPLGFVADGSTGPSTTTSTPVSVVLPAACNNQPQVQVRWITTNAVGNDEWVGPDDIEVTGTPIVVSVDQKQWSTVKGMYR